MTRDQAIQKICVALDVPNARLARELAIQLKSHVGFFKVGMELYNAEGPSVISTLISHGKFFWPLKRH